MLRRSRSARALVLILAVAMSGGCVKLHLDTHIAADGSVTCHVVYELSAHASAAAAKLDAATMVRPRDLTRARVLAASRLGDVTLLDHRLAKDAGAERVMMSLAGAAIDDLARILIALAGGDGRSGLAIDASLAAAAGGDSVLRLRLPPAQPLMPEAVPALLPHTGELDVRVTCTVPGDVSHSSAMEVEGRTSIWTLNAANLLHVMAMDPILEIRFSGQGLRLPAAAP